MLQEKKRFSVNMMANFFFFVTLEMSVLQQEADLM